MRAPEYHSLNKIYGVLKTLEDAPSCKQVVSEADRAEFDIAASFLTKAYTDEQLVRISHLSDAFHLMGIKKGEYRSSCARLQRVLAESGKRPVSEYDLAFARKALDHWGAIRINMT